MFQPWEIQLLGTLAVGRQGERIAHFPTEKVGLLLAYLAAFPQRIHTREALADRFWPESAPEAGRVSLRQALASLRRLLEPPDLAAGTVLLADRSQVGLNPAAFHTDVAQWDRMRALADQASTPSERLHWLQEATRCYGGSFLPGAFMDWVLEERQSRQEQYLETMLRLIDAQRESGDEAGAITTAQHLLRADPLCEEAHERLMRLYAGQGRLGQARSQYRKLCRLLRDELDMDPSPDIQTLYANLEDVARRRTIAGRHVSSAATPSLPTPLTPSPPTGIALQRHSEQRRSTLQPVPGVETEAMPQLPLRLTRFFGREQELGLLHDWLNSPGVRLITLTGMGGVGKTRLALEALRQPTRFGAGITFVPLSDTQDPTLLLPAILQALSLPAITPLDPLVRLAAMLNTRPHLLILDNFEQIAELAADTLWQLLERVPTVVCLVTSRQALNLEGEHELALGPLPLPAPRLPPQELIANPTVQLLVDRMRARRPDFQVTPANAGMVTALCTRLEGIPLAVELAAGWARDLTIGQMQERLTHRFELLVSRQRGVPHRHQSLRLTVESSYQLLPPALQRLLLRLSVFRGGWQEEMVTVACFPATTCSPADEDSEQAEGLRILREHSLITVHEAGERMRYGMLETLRTYGQEMLTAEEADRVQARHAAWFLKFAQEAAGQLRGPEQVYWLNRLEQEQDNLRGALEYGVAQDPQLGLRLANALYWFWYVRGYFRAGEQWLTALLERAPDAPPSERAWGLLAAGHLANCQSNNRTAVARYEAARALFEQLQDETGVAHTLCRLGNAAQEMLDPTTADRLCAESVARFRALNDPAGLVVALFYYANVPEMVQHERSSACFEEALALAEAQRDLRFQALLQHCLCSMRHISGDIAGAVRHCRNAAQLQLFVRDPLPLSYMLRELSALAMTRDDYPLAGRLYGAMHGQRQRLGYPISPHESVPLNELEARIRAGLSAAVYGQEFQYGHELDFDACLLLARETAEHL